MIRSASAIETGEEEKKRYGRESEGRKSTKQFKTSFNGLKEKEKNTSNVALQGQ